MSEHATATTRREYLGDGVYAEYDGWQVALIVPAEASNSGREQRIYLEPGVLAELNRYVKEASHDR